MTTTPKLPQTIEHVAVADLVPYARNARTHSDAQVAHLGAAIREFGWTNPVLIDESGGIIAGHGRVMAAQSLGMPLVPCIRLAHLTPAQKRALVLADNKLAEMAGWDELLLTTELQALGDMDFNLSLTGFDSEELRRLLGDVETTDMPILPSGEKSPFQQATFTLHNEQAEIVSRALAEAKAAGPFESSPNTNSNGNALARICEAYINGRR